MVLAEVEKGAIDVPAIELPELRWADLQEHRMRRYRRYAEGKLKNIDQGREFVDDIGFCFLFPAPNIEMPSLWTALNGRERIIPKHHHDHALSLTWDWKDTMPTQKWAWYGKLLRGKPMFVSLEMLPLFYALSENFGELDDYLQQFEDGKMSNEARKVYETLLEHGANSTNVLRKLSGLTGGPDPARRFERAIDELQVDLKIVKAGVSDDNRWKYCYVYDILLRRFPEVVEQARSITSREARKRILTRYLHNTGAVFAATLPRVFGWDPTLTARIVDELVAAGTMRQARLTGSPAGVVKPAKKSKKATDIDTAQVLVAAALIS